MFTFNKKKTVMTNHWGDEYRWVKRVIETCKNESQVRNAKKLIDLYVNKHTTNETYKTLMEIRRELTILADELLFDFILNDVKS